MDILHCDPHKPPQNHVKCWFLGNLSCNSNNSRNPVPPTKFSHSTATRPGNAIPQWTTKSSHNSIHHHRGRHQQNAICPLFHFRLHQSRIGCTLEKQFPEGRLTPSTLEVPLQSTTSSIQMGIYVD